MRNPISVVKKWLANVGNKRSPHWPAVRKGWLLEHPACAACGSVLNPEVHHKKPFHLWPLLELDPSNFITLCETMGVEDHLHIGHLGNWKSYNADVEQDAENKLKQQVIDGKGQEK